jgi:hypothetical protein
MLGQGIGCWQDFYGDGWMKSWFREPFFVFALVLLWRLVMLVFAALPVPANDAFGYDGAVAHFLHGRGYFNPGFSVLFPISGRQIYATYPPVYQGVLLVWMKLFGTSAISAMWLHLVMFAISGSIIVDIIRRYFPRVAGWALVPLFYFGFTFDDRPDGLAYIFGAISLWLVVREISGNGFSAARLVTLTATLFFGLYTSVIVGAFFFGIAFLTCAASAVWSRKFQWFAAFAAAAGLFVVVTLSIIKWEPLWWAGFMESARQQSVVSSGWHLPNAHMILKFLRTVPVFVIAVGIVPIIFLRWRQFEPGKSAWIALVAGIFVMGWVLLVAAETLLAPDYATFAISTQVILAAGLLGMTEIYFPRRVRLTRALLIACCVLVSVRAIGMSTWGVACAWKNSYTSTQKILRQEFAPFVVSDRPILISSAFLYCAEDMGVKNPVHAEYYFDHASWTNNAQLNAILNLRPTRLALTQFDYYRGFLPLLEALRQCPECESVRVRNVAGMPVPDARTSTQLVLQHISWAPVLVDLDWKDLPPKETR